MLKWILTQLLKMPTKFVSEARFEYFITLTITCLYTLILLPFPGISQDEENLSRLSKPYDNAKSAYFKTLGAEFGLSNGVSYKEYAQHNNDEGQPYFETNEWVEGKIYYDGIYYENVFLLYDVVNDKVVIDHPYGAGKLELISDKIDYFDINGHRFIRLVSTDNATAGTGFFELLYNGQSKLYAQWMKKRTEVIVGKDLLFRYENQNRIYLYKDNKFHTVKSKSSVLHALEDKKSLLQAYIKMNHLTFDSRRIESIVKILAYYESGI